VEVSVESWKVAVELERELQREDLLQFVVLRSS
jgi:hypothetical protein